MHSFDVPIFSSMAVRGIDYFHPLPPTHDFNEYFPYSTEEDEQLLLDINGFFSPPPTLLYSDTPSISPHHPSNQLYSNFPAAYDLDQATIVADNYLQNLTPNYDYFFQDQPLQVHDDLVEVSADNYFLLPDNDPPPKRQKRFHDPPYNMTTPTTTGFLHPPPQQFCACTIHGSNGESRDEFDHAKGKELGGGARATAQSVAARERRKKISEKTTELGKLVPGAVATKMNTAEMLQHAFKYVKFMQSQLSLLQLLPNSHSSKGEMINKELQIVGSKAVQEKLYMKDKCLVPVDLVEQLASNEDIESEGSISTDLKELIQSISAHSG